MFLKKLCIHNEEALIREINFHKGINLIIDETNKDKLKDSGNNVGKTTVLRLVDYCLGGKGQNIYTDTEFKNKGTNTDIENFLKQNNIIITLILKNDLEISYSKEICIRRNFLSQRNKRIQEIDGVHYNNENFRFKLKELFFMSENQKPSFRQIISKNIRDEKDKLLNTVRILHQSTKPEEYEALFLFWLGIPIDETKRKEKLSSLIKTEFNLQKRLESEATLSKIEQSLIIVNKTIEELENKKSKFNLNENYYEDFDKLNSIRSELNKLATEISQLEIRKDLILESKIELEKEIANIDVEKIQLLYKEAKVLIPNIQKTFEETLKFHNEMIIEKKNYITQDLPKLESLIKIAKQNLNSLTIEEENLSKLLKKSGALDELEELSVELNKCYEQKGNLEKQKELWIKSSKNLDSYKSELDIINKNINGKKDLIDERISIFNKYFSDISQELYGEKFILSADRNKKGFELNISTLSGNLGTGKKKGQIAAFDLAYIKFAEEIKLRCPHFILHDQVENIHDNQITSLLNNIVSKINCQYIVPVLKDKLPKEIDVEASTILTLSQDDKLFKI